MGPQTVTTTCVTTNPLASWPGMLAALGLALMVPLLTTLVVAPGTTYKILGILEVGRSHDPSAQVKLVEEAVGQEVPMNQLIAELHDTVTEAIDARVASAVDETVRGVKNALQPDARARGRSSKG